MACTIEAEDVFGPQVAPQCNKGFDFTLLFEDAFLSIAPLGIVSLLSLFKLHQLLYRSPRVQVGRLYHAKLITHAIFTVFQIVMLILLVIPELNIPKTRLTIASAALTSAVSIFLGLLSHLEHVREIRPSTILTLYFGASVFLDAVRCRTLWAVSTGTFATLFSISIGLRGIIFLLEGQEKVSSLVQPYAKPPRETAVGPINRSLFWWLNSLLWIGFRRILKVEELSPIDDRLNPPDEEANLFAKWDNTASKTPGGLVSLLMRHYKWPILAAVFPRLCLSGFTFAQPFLITRITNFVIEPDTPLTNDNGAGLIAATALVYLGLAITTANNQHKTYRVITMFRASLVSLIYRRTLSMSAPSVRNGAAVTLMSADVERIGTGMRYMHELWGSPIDVGLATYLLERQLGVACVAPSAMFLLCSMAGLKVASTMGERQKKWLEGIQKRVQVTSDMLGAMKEVRMAGLQAKMKQELQDLRIKEIEASRAFKRALVLILILSYTTTALAPVVAFAMFSFLAKRNNTEPLTTAKAFTSLALFALLRAPMSLILDALAGVVSSLGGLHRIGEYLTSEDDSIETRCEKPKQFVPFDIAKTEFPSQLATGIELTEQRKSGIAVPDSKGDMIIAVDASAGWDRNEPFVVKNLDCRIHQSSFTMIVGPVGCGKTTLLNTMLGETIKNSGSIKVRCSQIAFCSQAPWITNDTVRRNILGISPYNQQWYNHVVDACVLRNDLRLLPDGDQEMVGSKGMNMSGGQQARIALARAIYSKRKVVILDDVMSGLDAETENVLFNNIFGQNGLLRREDITVVLATNAVHRLSYADHVIVLNSEGRITEQGNYNALSATTKHAQSQPPEYSAFEETQRAGTDSEPNAAVEIPSTDGVTSGDRRSGDLTVYNYYTKTVGVLNTIIFVALCAIFCWALVFPQYVVKWWAAANDKQPNAHLGSYLGGYVGLAVLAILSLGLAAWHLVANMMPRASTKFHNALLDTTVDAPMAFFSANDVGKTTNRFSQDLQLIDMELPLALFNTAVEFLSAVAQFIMIVISAKYLGGALPVVLIAVYLVQKFYLRTTRQLRLLDIEAKAPLFSKFLELISGLVTIRAFGWERDFEVRNQKVLDLSQRPYYLLYCVQRWLNLVLDLLVTAIAIIVVTIAVGTRGKIDPGLVGIALVNIVNFSVSIKTLITNWTQLETSIGAASRIRTFKKETKSEHRPRERNVIPPDWPPRGAIRFEGVSATYDKNSRPVLNNLNLAIEPGQKVAICGRSGSGKSSIVSCLCRLLDYYQGSIYIDNIEISTLPREEYRSRLICSSQTPYLIAGTVRENIDPFGTAEDIDIQLALEKVELWGIVKEMGGLDAHLNGDMMSMGQRQLICLARATLREGSIVILDEATASLDVRTDEVVQRIVRSKFSRHTVITVAHRLNTILDYDRVAVICEGRLVEFDSPFNLLTRELRTMFKDLYSVSTGEIVDEKKTKSRAPRQRRNTGASHRPSTFHSITSFHDIPFMSALSGVDAWEDREWRRRTRRSILPGPSRTQRRGSKEQSRKSRDP